MVRHSHLHALFPHGNGKFADHVALWTHLHRIKRSHLAIPHGKVLMMLRTWHYVPCTRLLEECRPCISIEMLRLEHRDEVLVAEFVGWAKMLGVPSAGASRTVIKTDRHIVPEEHFQNVVVASGIQEFLVPFTGVRRNREDTELHKDTE